MTLTVHNALMRLGSPSAHAIMMLLALLIMAPFAQAQTSTSNIQLIVIDNPQCGACIKFKAEVGQTGFDEAPEAERATMSFVTMGVRPEQWFLDAYNTGRIQPIQYTPTFLFVVPTTDGNSREVGRFVGYRDREWFFQKVRTMLETIEPHMREGIFQEDAGRILYWNQGKSDIDAFDRRRSV